MLSFLSPLCRSSAYTCLFVNMKRCWNPISAASLNTSPRNHRDPITGWKYEAGVVDTSEDDDLNREISSGGLEPQFPTAETHSTTFDGVTFTDIPIIHIKTTKNNTITSLTSAAGQVLEHTSGGLEGFANAKKGTNIAAQATGITIAKRAMKRKIDMVRVCVRGVGPGRLPTIKGLQMAGLNIISISDTTPVVNHRIKSRKQRRL